MRIVTKIWSTDEHWKAEAEYAYVKLTSELAKVIASRFKLFDELKEKDPKLVEVNFEVDLEECRFLQWAAFNDNTKGFLPGDDAETHYDEHGWCEIPESSPFKGDLEDGPFFSKFGVSQEWAYMTIGTNGVNWESYVMDSVLRLQSDVLPRWLIQKLI
jgi:hypothetical protein